MSAAKLTLKLEESAINKAKTYAKVNRTSLSRLVESYFNEISGTAKKKASTKISPRVRELSGVLKGANIDYKSEVTSILRKKHGLD